MNIFHSFWLPRVRKYKSYDDRLDPYGYLSIFLEYWNIERYILRKNPFPYLHTSYLWHKNLSTSILFLQKSWYGVISCTLASGFIKLTSQLSGVLCSRNRICMGITYIQHVFYMHKLESIWNYFVHFRFSWI